MTSTQKTGKASLKIGKVAINLLIGEDIKSKLQELAAEDRRTMTLELEFLIEQEWLRRGNKKTEA